MNAEVMQTRVRCRAIQERDLDAVIGLLGEGFPARPAAYWRQGFERIMARPLPTGLPRFGYMIEHEGRPVGVILLIHVGHAGHAADEIRCNISSWYVDPSFRMHASMLIFFALKRKSVTYVNISPAPHTWATIEAQGFHRYTSGQFIGLPALLPGEAGVEVRTLDDASPAEAFGDLPERQLLRDHAAMGCLSLVVEARDGPHPFVLLPFKIKSGRVPLPARQLIYCRAIEDYLRFAGTIGRHLLRRGIPFVVHDANGHEPGMLGYFRFGMGQKYFRGPNPPRRGDIAYTERVIFGA